MVFKPAGFIGFHTVAETHGWLLFLSVYLVDGLSYDRRAFRYWSALAWMLYLDSFVCMPPAGAVMFDRKRTVIIHYVLGFSNRPPQTWMHLGLYLLVWMVALATLAQAPVHQLLRRRDSLRA